MINKHRRVVVIGGGISGLSIAFWLRQKGCDVTVLERSERVGGIIRSERIQGYTIDHAANCLMNFLPEVNHLIETVGLAGEQVFRNPTANKRYLLKDGKPRAVPLTPKEMLSSSFWPWKAKLRMAMEAFIPASDIGSEETVADFIRRRFGHELLEQAIDPFVAGTLSGDPEQACIQSVMPKFYEMEKRHGSVIRGLLAAKLAGVHAHYPRQLFSFKKGMEALPSAIGRYLGDRVKTGIAVETIERVGRQWILTAAHGVEEIRADAVVVATPAAVAARLIEPLSDVIAGQLKSVPYAPIAVLTLGFPTHAIHHQMDGMGCLIPAREKKNILGLFWNSSLFVHRAPDDHVLVTCYAGGMRNPEMLEHDDERLVDLAMVDLHNMMEIHGDPEFVRVIRHAKGLPQYHLGHPQRLTTIDEQLRLLPGLYLSGNYLDGVSVRDRIAKGKCLARDILQNIYDANHLADDVDIDSSLQSDRDIVGIQHVSTHDLFAKTGGNRTTTH